MYRLSVIFFTERRRSAEVWFLRTNDRQTLWNSLGHERASEKLSITPHLSRFISDFRLMSLRSYPLANDVCSCRKDMSALFISARREWRRSDNRLQNSKSGRLVGKSRMSRSWYRFSVSDRFPPNKAADLHKTTPTITSLKPLVDFAVRLGCWARFRS